MTAMELSNPPLRPWETSRPVHQSPPAPAPAPPSQLLPSISTLTASMSLGAVAVAAEKSPAQPPLERDSGNWSVAQSARSSTYSNNTTGAANGFHHAAGYIPASQPAHMPSEPPHTPVSSQPTTGFPSHHQQQQQQQQQQQPLPSINPAFDTTGQRPDYPESRRSSLDSRVNQGLSSLALSQASPYHSTNVSQTSIVSSLQRERGISGEYGKLSSAHRGPRYAGGQPLSPLGPRAGEHRAFPPGRTAPAISSNPEAKIYNAETPIPGMPYAFPDPYVARPSEKNARVSDQISRRDSGTESLASSRFTSDSRLPQGQQELPQSVHHHSLHHKQVRTLMGESEPINGATPYSRTPELRVSHKLAERKRRSEMKECFETLRTRLPSAQNNKSSKWETLNRAMDYITQLEKNLSQSQQERDQLRAEIDELRRYAASQPSLSRQTSAFDLPHHPAPALHPNGMASASQMQSPLYSSPFSPASTTSLVGHPSSDPSRTLPPLLNSSLAPMQGVQYTEERR